MSLPNKKSTEQQISSFGRTRRRRSPSTTSLTSELNQWLIPPPAPPPVKALTLPTRTAAGDAGDTEDALNQQLESQTEEPQTELSSTNEEEQNDEDVLFSDVSDDYNIPSLSVPSSMEHHTKEIETNTITTIASPTVELSTKEISEGIMKKNNDTDKNNTINDLEWMDLQQDIGLKETMLESLFSKLNQLTQELELERYVRCLVYCIYIHIVQHQLLTNFSTILTTWYILCCMECLLFFFYCILYSYIPLLEHNSNNENYTLNHWNNNKINFKSQPWKNQY